MQALVLDETRALIFFGGSRAVYCQALAEFVSLYRAGVPEIDAYLTVPMTAQVAALQRQVHRIAGAAGALGASRLVASADEVGLALRSAAFGMLARARVETLQRELASAVDAAGLALGDALQK